MSCYNLMLLKGLGILSTWPIGATSEGFWHWDKTTGTWKSLTINHQWKHAVAWVMYVHVILSSLHQFNILIDAEPWNKISVLLSSLVRHPSGKTSLLFSSLSYNCWFCWLHKFLAPFNVEHQNEVWFSWSPFIRHSGWLYLLFFFFTYKLLFML